MKHRPPWQLLGLAVVATLVLFRAGTGAVRAQTPPPWALTVSGQPVSLTDVVETMRFWFTGAGAQPVTKARSQMPPFAPYAWYAGRDKDGKPTLWTAPQLEHPKELPETVRTEIRRESAEARILLALDLGQGGPTWQRLYHAVPDDPAKRNAFAGEIVDAVIAASAWTVAKTTADRRWIFANVRAGLTRPQAYALLEARGLSATDPSGRAKQPASGVAEVELPGAFEPGCSFTHRITITFDVDDRVRKLDLNPPHPNCL